MIVSVKTQAIQYQIENEGNLRFFNKNLHCKPEVARFYDIQAVLKEWLQIINLYL